MKKVLLLSALLVSFLTFAQVPQGISYQAIALNGSGAPVVSSNVRVKLSILDASVTGTVLYSETQLKLTNAQGLFNLVIGQGTVVSGVFASINWGTNSKFLKVEMDTTGGTTYALVGTTQLLSVPYAMYAGKVASVAGNSGINDEIIDNKFANFCFANSSNSTTYAFNQNTGTWVGQLGEGTIYESNGNFCFANSSNSTTYAFSKKTGTWVGQLGGGTITSSNGNFCFANSSNSTTYAFNQNTGTWVGQLGGGTITSSNGNFCFANSSNSTTYAFSKKTGTWVGQLGGGTIISSNGNFCFANSSNATTYVFNQNTGTWVGQAGGGTIIASPTN